MGVAGAEGEAWDGGGLGEGESRIYVGACSGGWGSAAAGTTGRTSFSSD